MKLFFFEFCREFVIGKGSARRNSTNCSSPLVSLVVTCIEVKIYSLRIPD